MEEQRSPAGDGMDQGTRGRGCPYKEAKRRPLHPMGGKRVTDSEICTRVDLVILLKVMRLSEVGGERSCGIVSSMRKSDLSKPRKCGISWRPFEICGL